MEEVCFGNGQRFLRIIISFINMRRNKVKKISCGQSMQNFVKSYQFMLIPANLKRFPTKFLTKFVYISKFCPT